MENEPFKVRDLREKSHFLVDDVYLNGYAKVLGAYATAVYLSLCRHANFDTQKAFPSQKLIADEHGFSDRQVRREIDKLEFMNIIAIERTRKADKTWQNNTYILLDKSQWKQPQDYQSYGQPEDNDDISQRTTSPTKDSNKIKDSNIISTSVQKPKVDDSFIGNSEISYVIEGTDYENKAVKKPNQNKAYEVALAYFAKKRAEITGEPYSFGGSRIGQYKALKDIKKLMSNERAYEIWEELCESEFWQEKGFDLWTIKSQFLKKGK